MKKKEKKEPGEIPSLNLIEEAVHLLRNAPWGVHLCYYTGSIPFVLGLLYFWSDMSHSAYASDRIAGSSLGLAFLFVWMKCWQSVSASKLSAYLYAAEEPRWTLARVLRLVVMQASLQPTALIVRPLALLTIIPYCRVRAFYENAVILGDGGTAGLGAMRGNAGRMARLWPGQNMITLLWLLFFGFVIWLNVAVLMIAGPKLLRMLTGIETNFSQISILSLLFNTTFLAICTGCAYLCVNPLTKAVYVLRCFYGESLHSGDDLRLKVRTVAAAAVTALLLFSCAPLAMADTPKPTAAQDSRRVKTGALDDSITRVLKREEFAWRKPPPPSENFFTHFMDDVVNSLRGWGRRFAKWMDGWFKDNQPEESSHTSNDQLKGPLKLLIWGICGLVVCLLLWLVWKNRAGFRKRPQLKARPVPAVPDLNSEDVVASQLPEDEWLRLARELMERGELRLAVRALYLATLAHLGLRELISIARHKSNRDYQRELRRRARTREDLLNAFGDSVSIFEGIWYGSHEINGDILQHFSANIERIKTA